MRTVWTPVGLKSLDKTTDFIEEQWNEDMVDNFLDRLDERIEQLKANPGIGPTYKKTEFRRLLIHPLVTLYYEIKIDYISLTLIGLTYGSTRIRKSTYRRTSFIIIFLLFGGWSLVKLIGSSPGAAASTPNDLTFQSDSNIGTFYLARADKDGYLIFWKETFFSDKGTLTIEMEGTYPDRLRILKKIEGQFKELQPDLTISGNTYEPISINLSDPEFGELSNEGNDALKQVWKRNLMNYASTAVSILFVVSFIWLTIKKASNRR